MNVLKRRKGKAEKNAESDQAAGGLCTLFILSSDKSCKKEGKKK